MIQKYRTVIVGAAIAGLYAAFEVVKELSVEELLDWRTWLGAAVLAFGRVAFVYLTREKPAV